MKLQSTLVRGLVVALSLVCACSTHAQDRGSRFGFVVDPKPIEDGYTKPGDDDGGTKPGDDGWPINPIIDPIIKPNPGSDDDRLKPDPRLNPTAGVLDPRTRPPGMNDRGLADSTALGAGAVPFPTNTITLPSCGDPTALNFGQLGNCVYGGPPPPPPTCPAQPAPDNRTITCPTPQTGLIYERRTYTATAAPTCWVAGPWTMTGDTCSSPVGCGPQPPSETRNLACPSGQVGTITESRFYSAVSAPTCWVAEPWFEILRTCAATCAGVPQPAPETRTLSCPSGQSGLITESRSYFAAPAPTCWTPGSWSQSANTCAFPCPPMPPDETRTLACPAGFVGTGTRQTRSWVANGGATCWDPTPWTTVSENCEPDLGPDLGCGVGRPAASYVWIDGETSHGNESLCAPPPALPQAADPNTSGVCNASTEGNTVFGVAGCIGPYVGGQLYSTCTKVCN